MKKHRGETRCPLCRQEFTLKRAMRVHMVNIHGMSKETVARVTHKRIIATDRVAHGPLFIAGTEGSVREDPEESAGAASRPVDPSARAASSSTSSPYGDAS